MLIVNADDWGRSAVDTNAALACIEMGRCTSVSAMVFMEDSERAALIAKEKGIDVGLHLNFSEELTARSPPEVLHRAQGRTMYFLRRSRYAQVIYNPLLRADFEMLVRVQLEEFARLYSRRPSHIDGHQHLHLCSNLLFQHPIPDGYRIRRSFSFERGERAFVNRAYRAWVDRTLAKRYKITDYFFALSSFMGASQIDRIADLSRTHSVELMTHPRFTDEFDLLTSAGFADLIKELNLSDHNW